MAKFVWSTVALVVGAPCRPNPFDQFWLWVNTYMKGGKKFHMVGLAAICWALWTSRNAMCFEKKIIRSSTEIICVASSFLLYWTELQQLQGEKEALAHGAEVLKATALQLHHQQTQPEDRGMVLLQR